MLFFPSEHIHACKADQTEHYQDRKADPVDVVGKQETQQSAVNFSNSWCLNMG